MWVDYVNPDLAKSRTIEKSSFRILQGEMEDGVYAPKKVSKLNIRKRRKMREK